ncbi:MAG TPA: hypothetical protein VIG33_05705, partial [Pseudobdellovibrionaceae bacterium]
MLIFETRDPQERYHLQVHRFIEGFHEAPDSFLSEEELQYFHHITNDKRKSEYLQSRFVLKSWLSKR